MKCHSLVKQFKSKPVNGWVGGLEAFLRIANSNQLWEGDVINDVTQEGEGVSTFVTRFMKIQRVWQKFSAAWPFVLSHFSFLG